MVFPVPEDFEYLRFSLYQKTLDFRGFLCTGDFEFERKNPCTGIFHGTGVLQR